MNKVINTQKGFSIVEGTILLIVVAAVGLASLYVYNRSQDNNETVDTTSTQQATQTETKDDTPKVENTEDLQQAEEFVSETDIDQDLDTSELDAALSE